MIDELEVPLVSNELILMIFDNFDKVGGVPRYVLEKSEDWVKKANQFSQDTTNVTTMEMIVKKTNDVC
jgi:hypothetical protein